MISSECESSMRRIQERWATILSENISTVFSRFDNAMHGYMTNGRTGRVTLATSFAR